MGFKKHDFVELDIEGKISITGQIFESSIEKKEPVVLCIGSGMLLAALDKAILGKNVGDEFEMELKPEDAFGPRKPELVQLTNINVFKKSNIHPAPGQQVNIDGMIATIRSVNGGRVTIDFNHPLAGKNVKFKIKIRKIVTDVRAKLETVCRDWRPKIKETEKGFEISVPVDLPEKISELKIKQLKELIPELKDKEIKFAATKENVSE